jgi:hypothetical protein
MFNLMSLTDRLDPVLQIRKIAYSAANQTEVGQTVLAVAKAKGMGARERF